MNNKFDEMAKGLAQSVTRRQALRRFGVGFAAVMLASLGFANKAQAAKRCSSSADCPAHQVCAAGHCVKCNSASPYCPNCCNAPTFDCDKVYVDPTVIRICIGECYQTCFF